MAKKSPASRPIKAAKALTHTVGAASSFVGSMGRAVWSSSLSLPGLGSRSRAEDAPSLGASPGIESMRDVATPPKPGEVTVRCVDYGPEGLVQTTVDDLDGFLKQPRPEASKVRWINVDGLHPNVVDRLRRHFGFHTLAAEDVLRVPQRPKVEDYEGHLFIVLRMLRLEEDRIEPEQVSFFLFGDTLLTFQERSGDVWDPVRERLKNEQSRLRQQDVSYLLYSLADSLIDHCFPILEHFGDRLEDLEDMVMDNPTATVQHAIHRVRRELTLLRRVIWPSREVISLLTREETKEMSPFAKTYMRDVYDHAIQVMDVVETYREMAGGLNELYMSTVSNRMNEVMKVLTMMASFFIPITFIAGVYGMNFEHIPELSWPYSYAVFWAVCVGVVIGLAYYFWRKGWMGRS